MLQGQAVEELHGDEGLAALVVNFVDGADVGMIQSGGGLRFALETGQGLGIFGNFVGQEFERYEAAEFEVFGFVDNPHAATTELFDDSIVRDGLADHCGILRGGKRQVNEGKSQVVGQHDFHEIKLTHYQKPRPLPQRPRRYTKKNPRKPSCYLVSFVVGGFRLCKTLDFRVTDNLYSDFFSA